MLRYPLALCLVLSTLSCRSQDAPLTPETPPQPIKTLAEPQGTFESTHALADTLVETARVMAIPTRPLEPSVVRGVAIPLYNEFPDLDYETMATRATEIGATHVSLPVMWRQRTIHHNRIAPSPAHSAEDDKVESIVKAATAAGLQVMIFPIVHVERRSQGEWRGKMAPTDLAAWQADYRRFILHYAEVAQRTHADTLSVGSELSSMESDLGFWTTLIRDVRARYKGKLIYSANWDHYHAVKFWDQLDYVGVSSYFEVGKRADEPIFVLADRWRMHRQAMLRFAAGVDRPLIMTEVGYPSVDSATVKPWDYTTKSAPNHNAQLAGYRALVDAFTQPDPHFGGLFVWHAWGYGGPDDTSYAFWGKPTQGLLTEWYAKPN